jgi:hypothetical protein
LYAGPSGDGQAGRQGRMADASGSLTLSQIYQPNGEGMNGESGV